MNLKTAHFSILTTTALRSSKFSGRSAVFMVFVWCDGGLTYLHSVSEIFSIKYGVTLQYGLEVTQDHRKWYYSKA